MQSLEDLKHLLFCTTLELESARLAIKYEAKWHEDKVRQLLNILKLTFREIGEARIQCQKLQETILQRGRSDLHYGLSNV